MNYLCSFLSLFVIFVFKFLNRSPLRPFDLEIKSAQK